jgi:hypothetical protein
MLLAVSVIALLPLYRIGYPTSFTQFAADAAIYAPAADFVMEYTRNAIFSGDTFRTVEYDAYRDLFLSSFRWGPPFLLAYLSALTGLLPYELYSLLMAVLFVTFALAFYATLRRIVPVSSRLFATVATLATVVSYPYLYMYINNWTGQLYMALTIAITGIGLSSRTRRQNPKMLFAVALTLNSLFVMYAEGAPVICAVAALTILIGSGRLALKRALLWSAGVVAVNPAGTYVAIQALLFRFGSIGAYGIGIGMPNLLPPLYALGYVNILSGSPLAGTIMVPLSMILALVLAYGAWNMRTTPFPVLTAGAALALLAYMAASKNDSYTNFKVLAAFLPAFSLVFIGGVAGLGRLTRIGDRVPHLEYLPLSFITASCVWFAIQSFPLYRDVLGRPYVVTREHRALTAAAGYDNPFLAGPADEWNRKWSGYFLGTYPPDTIDRLAYPRTHDVFLDPSPVATPSGGITRSDLVYREPRIREEAGTIRIVEARAAAWFGRGFYPVECSGDTCWRWMGARGTLHAEHNADQPIELVVVVVPVAGPTGLGITVDGRTIETSVPETGTELRIPIAKDKVTPIRIISRDPAQVPNPAVDRRELTVRITDMRWEVADLSE